MILSATAGSARAGLAAQRLLICGPGRMGQGRADSLWGDGPQNDYCFLAFCISFWISSGVITLGLSPALICAAEAP